MLMPTSLFVAQNSASVDQGTQYAEFTPMRECIVSPLILVTIATIAGGIGGFIAHSLFGTSMTHAMTIGCCYGTWKGLPQTIEQARSDEMDGTEAAMPE